MSIRPDDVLAALVESSVRASLVIVAVSLVLAALRVRAGGVRHAAWTAVLVAMLLLPVLPKWLPDIPVSFVPDRVAAAVTIAPAPPPAAATVPALVAPLAAANPATRATAVPPPVARQASMPAEPVNSSAILVALWAAGALLAFARLLVGWRYAMRLAASSQPSPIDRSLLESDLVATPVAVGVFAPRIILPIAWRSSPDDMRQAVLIHERAHIRRRDTLVAFLARLNRCVFWFHPLAWWLERRITIAAELACDDEVIRASGNTTRYAELLVEMADAVRARGGRVAWQGVGMAERGSLQSRIERILSGRAAGAMSRTRKAVVAATCASVIVLGVACQRTVAPLQPDPEVAERLARQQTRVETWEAATSMSLDQVAAVEAVVAQNPGDLDSSEKLIFFYTQRAQRAMGWNEMVAARRPHLLRMIEHRPESQSAMWPMKRAFDPKGYAQARALWMKHVAKPDVTPSLLGAAASFFRISEKPVAEELLLRAMALDPQGPQPRVVGDAYYSPWPARLGMLYAQAIVGSDDEMLFNVTRSVSLAEANGPFAAAAKKKLAASSDAAMLRAAGQYLTSNVGRREEGTIGDQKTKLGFDYEALGESYLDRSIALDPDSESTKHLLLVREREALERVQYAQRRAVLDERGNVDEAKLAALSESDRLEVLPMLAIEEYMSAENAEWTRRDTFEAQFAESKRLADAALALAEKVKPAPRYGPSVYSAHVTRGLAALRARDRRLAVTHMRAATEALRDGDVLDGWSVVGQSRLANYLLNWGERESVAEFYERSAMFAGPNGEGMLKSAKAIREGRMPMEYQYFVTPH